MTDPYAASPDAGNKQACDCHGAWHEMQQHCVDWPCPGCEPYRICSREPGIDMHADDMADERDYDTPADDDPDED
jgi:hypothetical protein